MSREMEERSPAATRTAAAILERGGVLLYPTDTIYGLGCDALNPGAVEKVRVAKQRSADRSFLVLASGLEQVKRIFKFEPGMESALSLLWPGPRTVILRPRTSALDHLLGDNGKIGVRVPRDPFLARLFKRWDGLLVSTSANRSGEPYRNDWRALARIFLSRTDLLVRRRNYRRHPPSALLDYNEGKWKVLRPGPLPRNFPP